MRKKGFERFAGLSLAVATALGPTACSSSAGSPAPSPSESTTSATATPSATETPTAPESSSANPNEEAAERYREMPADEFNSLDIDKRLILIQAQLLALENGTDGSANFDWGTVYSEKDKPLSEAGPLNNAGAGTPDGQEIYESSLFMEQFANAQTEDYDSGSQSTLDKPMAEKMLSGMFYYVGKNANTTRYQAKVDGISANETVTGIPTSAKVDTTSDLETIKDEDGNRLQARQITFLEAGRTQEWTMVFKPFTDSDLIQVAESYGVTDPGLWLVYEQRIVK